LKKAPSRIWALEFMRDVRVVFNALGS